MKQEWVVTLRDQCHRSNVNFFFKQWGSWGVDGVKRSKKANGRNLEGKVWDMIPAIAV